MTCEYVKTDKGYATSCGRSAKHIGKGWKYCPFCRKIIKKGSKE